VFLSILEHLDISGRTFADGSQAKRSGDMISVVLFNDKIFDAG